MKWRWAASWAALLVAGYGSFFAARRYQQRHPRVTAAAPEQAEQACYPELARDKTTAATRPVPMRMGAASLDQLPAAETDSAGQEYRTLPGGLRLYGAEETDQPPRRDDVLPVHALLDRYPETAFAFQAAVDDEALRACGRAYRIRAGGRVAHSEWSLIIRATGDGQQLRVEQVESDGWDHFDQELRSCITAQFLQKRWPGAQRELAFEYPMRLCPDEDLDGEGEAP